MGLLLAAGLAVGIAGVAWVSRLAVTRQPSHTVPAGELVAGRCFGQTFQADFSGLHRIEVLLATYARENRGPVRLRVSETPEGEALATVEIDARSVKDNAFHAFAFPPIEDAAGRRFFFCLEAPEATSGNALTVWRADFDAYAGGQAIIDGEPVPGDLAFILHYRAPASEVWSALKPSIRAYSPLLWRTRYLMAGVAGAWIMGVGWLLGWILIPKSNGGRT